MRRRVLVVDDDSTVSEVVVDYLRRAGFDAESTTDGEQALTVAAVRPPDLTVLDLMLPDMDGIEVCRRLRGARPMPVIMLTALGEESDRVRTTIAVATACSVLTVVAGMIRTARAMFLSAHDFGVVLLVCIASAVVAILLGLLLAREVVDEARDVQEAARAMAEGEPPSPPPPSTTELAAVSRELEETSKRWAESREREAALEAARHELVAWISHDLRSPLAGVRAMAEALEDDVAQDRRDTTDRSARRWTGCPQW
ncbi:MAG: response regulator [Actinomycetota bacterium]|nr:response regulator [Actinomycetota bacterium]